MSDFQKLYQQYAKPVYCFLLSLSGDANMAEELLQETFYQALLHIHRFEGRSSLYTWLCQIGKNAWLKECRRSRRYSDTALEELNLPSREDSPEEAYIRKEEQERLRQAVRKLQPPYSDVFVLHVYGGLKLKEIAALHGKSESWARMTYQRARQQIAKEVMK